MFSKRLREPIMKGDITCSVRVWQNSRVKVGGRYRLGPGAVRVTSIREIGFEGVTSDLARRSGFEGVVDLLRMAKYGPGEKVYLVEFGCEAKPAAAETSKVPFRTAASVSSWRFAHRGKGA